MMKTSDTMKSRPGSSRCNNGAAAERRGSTLVIVLALLSLLSFLGLVFYSFAKSERAAAEYFSEAAKAQTDEPANVWDHMLRQVTTGPDNRATEKRSILWSPSRRHSLVQNLVGTDIYPHTGQAIRVVYDTGTGAPIIDLTGDGSALDEDGSGTEPNNQQLLNFVDSPVARGGLEQRPYSAGSPGRPLSVPQPDVDYTYPDINNMFLAYRGWAIRDNGAAATPRYERVPVIIPSFMRPQYMKTSTANGPGGANVPTDQFWAYGDDGAGNPTDIITPANRSTLDLATFQARSFRPNPNHIVGFLPDGVTPVFRYLTDAEAAGLGVVSGGFPFVPENHPSLPNNVAVRGEMGVWTGSNPGVYELDVDNDGDGINEGIWLDLSFPIQEHVDSGGTPHQYVVLHSVTIYDLDSLIDINVHGNLAGLDRSGTFNPAPPTFGTDLLSRSNLGLGPNEINPLWALRRDDRDVLAGPLPPFRDQINLNADLAYQFTRHYGRVPETSVDQANMELLWLLTGRVEFDLGGTPPNDVTNLFAGRWGEQDRAFNAIRNTGMVADLPRPGRTGNAQQVLTSGIRYGGDLAAGPGRNGFDDNQDRYEGEIVSGVPGTRAFGTPMDYAGVGRTHTGIVGAYSDAGNGVFVLSGDPRLPQLHHDLVSTGPERWLGYVGYSLTRGLNTALPRYIFGQNGTFDNGAGDDLIGSPFLDPLFEDPLEAVFDVDLAQRPWDQIFGAQDLLALHMTAADIGGVERPTTRMSELAPWAFADANPPFSFNENTSPSVRSRFTTLSNSLRRFMMSNPFGADGRPGDAGVDDDGDGTIDEPDEVFATTYRDNDHGTRPWEFSADTDGADRNNDGFADGDGLMEFPPQFGPSIPYSVDDPFRPQVRRMLTMEAGELRGLMGQLPLSINHILDVDRVTNTPQEGTTQFLYYMQRSGLRLRPLTEHPAATDDPAVLSVATIPTWTSGSPVAYPPTDYREREYWARRDRQKLARDIFVLLYTIGGNSLDTGATPNRPFNYTLTNDPNAAEGGSLYTHEQLRRMAQFAVNLVDAMDKDDVITKFEYDKNFEDGWDLDDDPYGAAEFPALTSADVDYFAATGNGMYPEDSNEHGVVYGVEAQKLTFSEVLGMNSPDFMPGGHMDSAATLHNDETGDHRFLHIELQNMWPAPVDLATTVTGNANQDQAVWQLARFDRTADTDPQLTIPTETVTFMAGNGAVNGGERFTIAMVGRNGSPADANPSGWGTADIYVDSAGGGTFDLVSPDVVSPGVTAGSPVTPNCDLDLCWATYGSQRWLASGNSTEPGRFLEAMQNYQGNQGYRIPPRAADLGFDLVLRRRQNPNMPSLPIADNPWVEVDRIRVTFSDLFDVAGASPALQLNEVRSWERAEPLDAAFTSAGLGSYERYPVAQTGDPSPQLYRFNTVGSELNSGTGRKTNQFFELWQMHYDRDFASSIELMHLPVVGPNLLTNRLNRMRMSPYQQVFDDPLTMPAVGDSDGSWVSSASAMFLNADFPDITDGAYDHDNNSTTAEMVTSAAIEASRDNRWYRLFQFVEVPSRVHRMLGNYLALDRVPGKLNINMIRHREVYAGLIDNPLFADVPRLADLTPGGAGSNGFEDAPFLSSQAGVSGSRDLWHEFINERDGQTVTSYDATAITPGPRQYWLPGTPNSRPYRSPGNLTEFTTNDNGLENTVLRRLFADRDDDGDGIPDELVGDDPITNRNWLEVGTVPFHVNPNTVVGGTGSSTVHRHQILSKIMNNTTTVSNTFIVFSTAAYFEAIEDPPGSGLFRIGGRYDLDEDGDPDNDRQRAVFLLDRTEAFKAFDPGTGDFNWERLVRQRLTIE